MKKVLTLTFLLGTFLAALGQEKITTESYDASKVKRIDLAFKYPELIKVDTWDKKEVQIKADVLINDGDDNDRFEVKSRIRDGVLIIESDIDDIDSFRNYNINSDREEKRGGITISRNGTTISRGGRGRNNSVTVSVMLEIMVPKGMEVKMDARYGMVELLSNASSFDIEARYGGVDVLVNEKQGLDIEAGTQWGQIYHNLDSKLRAKGDGFPGKWMRTTASINGGSHKLYVESQYGNVYLRKNN